MKTKKAYNTLIKDQVNDFMLIHDGRNSFSLVYEQPSGKITKANLLKQDGDIKLQSLETLKSAEILYDHKEIHTLNFNIIAVKTNLGFIEFILY